MHNAAEADEHSLGVEVLHSNDDYYTSRSADDHSGGNNHKSGDVARYCQMPAPESASMTNRRKSDTEFSTDDQSSRQESYNPRISDHTTGSKNSTRNQSKPDIQSYPDSPIEHSCDTGDARNAATH